MDAALYLLHQSYSRIIGFFRHWYVDGLSFIAHQTINALMPLERFFAWRITLKNIFQPLYQDHSIVGHTLGFVFRFIRLAIASVIYALFILVAVVIAFIWAIIPISIIWYGIK